MPINALQLQQLLPQAQNLRKPAQDLRQPAQKTQAPPRAGADLRTSQDRQSVRGGADFAEKLRSKQRDDTPSRGVGELDGTGDVHANVDAARAGTRGNDDAQRTDQATPRGADASNETRALDDTNTHDRAEDTAGASDPDREDVTDVQAGGDAGSRSGDEQTQAAQQVVASDQDAGQSQALQDQAELLAALRAQTAASAEVADDAVERVAGRAGAGRLPVERAAGVQAVSVLSGPRRLQNGQTVEGAPGVAGEQGVREGEGRATVGDSHLLGEEAERDASTAQRLHALASEQRKGEDSGPGASNEQTLTQPARSQDSPNTERGVLELPAELVGKLKESGKRHAEERFEDVAAQSLEPEKSQLNSSSAQTQLNGTKKPASSRQIGRESFATHVEGDENASLNDNVVATGTADQGWESSVPASPVFSGGSLNVPSPAIPADGVHALVDVPEKHAQTQGVSLSQGTIDHERALRELISGGGKNGEPAKIAGENGAAGSLSASTTDAARAVAGVLSKSQAANVETLPGAAQSKSVAQRMPADAQFERVMAAQLERGVMAAMTTPAGIVTLRLHPASLGQIRVQVQMDKGVGGSGGVSAKFEASSARAKDAITRGVDGLKEALEERGLELTELSVSVAQPMPTRGYAMPVLPVPERAETDGRLATLHDSSSRVSDGTPVAMGVGGDDVIGGDGGAVAPSSDSPDVRLVGAGEWLV